MRGTLPTRSRCGHNSNLIRIAANHATDEDAMLDYTMIPDHCRHGLQAYIEVGQPVGSFLHAVLCDSLVQAFEKADSINRDRLIDYAAFLYQQAPMGCWGSPELVKAWIEKGGLKGR